METNKEFLRNNREFHIYISLVIFIFVFGVFVLVYGCIMTLSHDSKPNAKQRIEKLEAQIQVLNARLNILEEDHIDAKRHRKDK